MKDYQQSNEDAMFSTLLDIVAQIEGERLEKLAARLNSDPRCALPEEVVDRMVKHISEIIERKEQEGKGENHLS